MIQQTKSKYSIFIPIYEWTLDLYLMKSNEDNQQSLSELPRFFVDDVEKALKKIRLQFWFPFCSGF